MQCSLPYGTLYLHRDFTGVRGIWMRWSIELSSTFYRGRNKIWIVFSFNIHMKFVKKKLIIQILLKCIVIWLWSCGLYNIPYGYKLNQVNFTCRSLNRLSLSQVKHTAWIVPVHSASFLRTWISISVFPISISVNCVLYKLCDYILLYILYQIYILNTFTMIVYWIMQCIRLYFLY